MFLVAVAQHSESLLWSEQAETLNQEPAQLLPST